MSVYDFESIQSEFTEESYEVWGDTFDVFPHYTVPWYLFNMLDSIFGPFTVDVHTTLEGRRCQKYYTGENGLKVSWEDQSVFCHPPHSDYWREVWLAKVIKERKYAKNIVCVLPAITDANYWHDYVLHANEIIFLRGSVNHDISSLVIPYPLVVAIYDKGETPTPLLSSMDVEKIKSNHSWNSVKMFSDTFFSWTHKPTTMMWHLPSTGKPVYFSSNITV